MINPFLMIGILIFVLFCIWIAVLLKFLTSDKENIENSYDGTVQKQYEERICACGHEDWEHNPECFKCKCEKFTRKTGEAR